MDTVITKLNALFGEPASLKRQLRVATDANPDTDDNAGALAAGVQFASTTARPPDALRAFAKTLIERSAPMREVLHVFVGRTERGVLLPPAPPR